MIKKGDDGQDGRWPQDGAGGGGQVQGPAYAIYDI